MRVNLAKKQSVLVEKFINHTLTDFVSEYDFPSKVAAKEYVTTGKQGLDAYVQFLKGRGYDAEMYYLLPNKDLFTDVGEGWQQIARKSPSYGFTIRESDPKLVEFKLKHG